MSTFRERLGQSESGGNYGARNSEGFSGKYQLGPDRLSDFMSSTGKKFSMSQFQTNPALQEEVQAWHEDDILTFVADQGLDKFIGQQVGGVVMSPESMLAMAHLGGKSGMKKFIETDGEYNPSDSNGTRLSDYASKIPSKQLPAEQQDLQRMARDSMQLTPQVAEKDGGLMAAARKLLSRPSAPRPKGLTPPGTFQRGGQMSPLSGGISTALPNADMIQKYSTPGGIGSLSK
jgi:hypothetical protein